MLASVLAFACVVYTNGQEQCDVRTQYDVTVLSMDACKVQANTFASSLASNAFNDESVSFIQQQSGTCYATELDLDDALNNAITEIQARGATFTTTHY